jgi:hypothetical protein
MTTLVIRGIPVVKLITPVAELYATMPVAEIAARARAVVKY